ncbi:MAG: hypothetical protein K2X44_00405 [Magnetospirillum sp.]|nr:hypothetical protein [Magnetospirillum sp.]
MFELAVTQGADVIRYTRNAKTIELPDGSTVMGPLSALPHVAGDYAIRQVVVDGPEAGPLEIGGTAPPVVDGDVVVVRRTVTPGTTTLDDLKMRAVIQLKNRAGTMLAPSDWKVIRASEGVKPLDDATAAYRAAVREASNAHEAAIHAAQSPDQISAVLSAAQWPQAEE